MAGRASSAALLFIVIFLLLITGQTIIFLLRLVAADRRGRRRPLASGTKTVGELEDEARTTRAAPRTAEPPPEPSRPDAEPVGADRVRLTDPAARGLVRHEIEARGSGSDHRATLRTRRRVRQDRLRWVPRAAERPRH